MGKRNSHERIKIHSFKALKSEDKAKFRLKTVGRNENMALNL